MLNNSVDHRDVDSWPRFDHRNRTVVSVESITGLDAPGGSQSTYRLELDDGSLLKARRLSSPEAVAEMDGWLRFLALPAFPRPLEKSGSSLLEPWIEGEALDHLALESRHFVNSGRLLAGLHIRAHWPEARSGTIGRRLFNLDRYLETLRTTGVLTAGESRTCQRVAHSSAPTWEAWGLVHWDFCAENLVLTGDGVIVSIDNVNLSPGALDLDLARTFIRWPMSTTERRFFLSGYGGARSAQQYLRHEAFWLTIAAVTSLNYRLLVGATDLESPSRALYGAVLHREAPHHFLVGSAASPLEARPRVS